MRKIKIESLTWESARYLMAKLGFKFIATFISLLFNLGPQGLNKLKFTAN